MKTILYTFRTFSLQDELKEISDEVFVFGKLKQDLEVFFDTIKKESPDFIVGVALSDGESRIETKTVNQFSGGKVIEKTGADSIELYIPPKNIFDVSETHTSSFCNWAMYKIADFIKSNNLKTKLIFIHLNKGDVNFFRGFYKGLSSE